MKTIKLSSLSLGLALMLSTALVGSAQTSQPSSDPLPVAQTAQAAKAHTASSTKAGMSLDLAPTSYSDYCAYHFSGSGVIINCSDARINANSRVVASISEYATNPSLDRFIGAARMTVHNVRPYDGGFNAWVDVEWDYPLNVRGDFFVEP
jgi:S1-C subfamily serine protease